MGLKEFYKLEKKFKPKKDNKAVVSPKTNNKRKSISLRRKLRSSGNKISLSGKIGKSSREGEEFDIKNFI